ncbi:hypothetical protein QFZ97_006906 [Paraburkholderia youngii]
MSSFKCLPRAMPRSRHVQAPPAFKFAWRASVLHRNPSILLAESRAVMVNVVDVRYRIGGTPRRGVPLDFDSEYYDVMTPISGLVSTEYAMPTAVSSRVPVPHLIAEAERARFFISWLRRIAPDTHQDLAIGVVRLPSPWWLRHPRRTLVPQCVHGVRTSARAAGLSAPIHSWLAVRAIRLYCISEGVRHFMSDLVSWRNEETQALPNGCI